MRVHERTRVRVCKTAWHPLPPRLWPTEAPIVTRLWQLFCHSCDFADAIAVPIFIHKNDLKKLAPLWTAK